METNLCALSHGCDNEKMMIFVITKGASHTKSGMLRLEGGKTRMDALTCGQSHGHTSVQSVMQTATGDAKVIHDWTHIGWFCEVVISDW